MKKGLIRFIGLCIAIVLTIALCGTLLTACNDVSEDESDEVERPLYLYDITFSEDDDFTYVYLTFSNTGEKIEGASTLWKSEDASSGIWYRTSNTHIVVEPARIFSAVENSVPQEELLNEGATNYRLKVIIRYDTIYKSIKSDGEVKRANRTYSHFFFLDDSLSEQSFTLSLKSANSANWYSALLACAIAVGAIVAATVLIVKGRLWQKKKTRE